MRSQPEENVRHQGQLWRSRRWPRKRERRIARTTMTTMKMTKMSIPPCRSLSRQESRAMRSHLLEVLRNVPNARSSSPWCARHWFCGENSNNLRSVKTKYTVAADPPPGYLCISCAKASGTDPFKKPAPRKRKSAAEKRGNINFQEREFPTLVSLCIKVCVIVS